MLEQQQRWLVCGLRQLYNLSIQGKSWPGEPLKGDANGNPLTHDVLSRLGVLDNAPEANELPQKEKIAFDSWLRGPSHMISPSLYGVDAHMPYSPPRVTEIPFPTIPSSESLQSGEPGLKHNSFMPYLFPTLRLPVCDGTDPNIADYGSICPMDEPLFSDEIELAENRSGSPGNRSLSSSLSSNTNPSLWLFPQTF